MTNNLSFISIASGAEIWAKEFNNTTHRLSFDDDTRRLSFNMTIIDDGLFQQREEVSLELRFADPVLQDRRSEVVLHPNVSTVFIMDDDSNNLHNSYS